MSSLNNSSVPRSLENSPKKTREKEGNSNPVSHHEKTGSVASQINFPEVKTKFEKDKNQNESEELNAEEELKGVESLKNQPSKASTALDYGGNAFGFSHVRPEVDGFW